MSPIETGFDLGESPDQADSPESTTLSRESVDPRILLSPLKNDTLSFPNPEPFSVWVDGVEQSTGNLVGKILWQIVDTTLGADAIVWQKEGTDIMAKDNSFASGRTWNQFSPQNVDSLALETLELPSTTLTPAGYTLVDGKQYQFRFSYYTYEWFINNSNNYYKKPQGLLEFNSQANNKINFTVAGQVVVITPDPPVITNVVTSGGKGTEKTITFNTDTPCHATIKYGLTTSYGSVISENTSASAVTAHTIVIDGLTANTEYNFTINATDATSGLNSGDIPNGTFETGDFNKPTQENFVMSKIDNSSATLTYTTIDTVTGLSQNTYGEVSLVKFDSGDNFQVQVPQTDDTINQNTSTNTISLIGLESGTTYQLKIRSRDYNDTVPYNWSIYNYLTFETTFSDINLLTNPSNNSSILDFSDGFKFQVSNVNTLNLPSDIESINWEIMPNILDTALPDTEKNIAGLTPITSLKTTGITTGELANPIDSPNFNDSWIRNLNQGFGEPYHIVARGLMPNQPEATGEIILGIRTFYTALSVPTTPVFTLPDNTGGANPELSMRPTFTLQSHSTVNLSHTLIEIFEADINKKVYSFTQTGTSLTFPYDENANSLLQGKQYNVQATFGNSLNQKFNKWGGVGLANFKTKDIAVPKPILVSPNSTDLVEIADGVDLIGSVFVDLKEAKFQISTVSGASEENSTIFRVNSTSLLNLQVGMDLQDSTDYFVTLTYTGNSGLSSVSDEFIFTTSGDFIDPESPWIRANDETGTPHYVTIHTESFPKHYSETNSPDGTEYAEIQYYITSDGISNPLTTASSNVYLTMTGVESSENITVIPSPRLADNTKYIVWARYNSAESHNSWSQWLKDTITTSSLTPIPENRAPEDGLNNLDPEEITLILEIPGFSDFANINNAQFQIAELPFDFDSGNEKLDTTDGEVVGTSTVSLVANSDNFINGGLAPATGYYWRARVYYNGNWSVYSNPTHFLTTGEAPPDTPTITSPTEGDIGVSLTATITSSAFVSNSLISDTHKESEWEVRTAPNESAPVIFSSYNDSINLLSIDTAGLQGFTTYYVRVLHLGNLGGSSAWSPWVGYQTTADVALSPTIVSPYIGETNVAFTGLKMKASTYNSLAEHTSSDWKIATDIGMTTVVWSSLADTGNLEEIVVTPDLNGNTIYFATVGYTNSGGTSTSPVLQFKTRDSLPTAPTILDIDGDVSASPTDVVQQPEFTITDYVGPDYHEGVHLQVSTNDSLAPVLVFDGELPNTITNQFDMADADLIGYWVNSNLLDEATKFNYEDTYYVRARYKSTYGWSDWGAYKSFTIKIGIPVKPTITSPVEGTRNVPLLATLTSSAYSYKGASGHDSSDWEIQTDNSSDVLTQIWYSTDDAVNLESIDLIDGTFNTTADPILDEDTLGKLHQARAYKVRVRYTNAGGDSEWSNWTDFLAIPEQGLKPSVLPNLDEDADGDLIHVSEYSSASNFEDNYSKTEAYFESSVWDNFSSGNDIYGEHIEAKWELFIGTNGLDPDNPTAGQQIGPQENFSNITLPYITLTRWNIGAFGNAILDSGGNSFMKDHRMYHVRVKYRNDWGWTEWSDLFRWRTLPAVPVKPSLITPADTTIDIDWETELNLISTVFKAVEDNPSDATSGVPRSHLQTEWLVSKSENFLSGITYPNPDPTTFPDGPKQGTKIDIPLLPETQVTNPSKPKVGVKYDEPPVKSVTVPYIGNHERRYREGIEYALAELNPYLPTNTYLYVKLRHKNVGGWSEWSDTTSFLTLTDYPERPNIITPLINRDDLNKVDEEYKGTEYEGEISSESGDVGTKYEVTFPEELPITGEKINTRYNHIQSRFEIWAQDINSGDPILTDEGFTLSDNAGVTTEFRYAVDGESTSGGDVDIEIISTDSRDEVATKTAFVINSQAGYIAEVQVGDFWKIDIRRSTVGGSNLTNTNSIVNPNYLVPDFIDNGTALVVYLPLLSVIPSGWNVGDTVTAENGATGYIALYSGTDGVIVKYLSSGIPFVDNTKINEGNIYVPNGEAEIGTVGTPSASSYSQATTTLVCIASSATSPETWLWEQVWQIEEEQDADPETGLLGYHIPRTDIDNNITTLKINNTFGRFLNQLAGKVQLDFLKRYRMRISYKNLKGWSLWSNDIDVTQGFNFHECTTTFSVPTTPICLSPGLGDDSIDPLPETVENPLLPEWYSTEYETNTIKVQKVDTNPELVGSEYKGDGDSQQLTSQFEVASDGLFLNIVWSGQKSYGRDEDLNKIIVNSASGQFFTDNGIEDDERLNFEQTYYWRVRYSNEAGYSDWSDDNIFKSSRYLQELKFVSSVSKELPNLIDRVVHPHVAQKSPTFKDFINTWLKWLDKNSAQFAFNLTDFNDFGKFHRMTESFDWDETITDANYRNYMNDSALRTFKEVFGGKIPEEILRYFRELNARKGSKLSLQVLSRLLGHEITISDETPLKYTVTASDGKLATQADIDRFNMVLDLFHPAGVQRIVEDGLSFPVMQVKPKFTFKYEDWMKLKLVGYTLGDTQVTFTIDALPEGWGIGTLITASNGATGTIVGIDGLDITVHYFASDGTFEVSGGLCEGVNFIEPPEATITATMPPIPAGYSQVVITLDSVPVGWEVGDIVTGENGATGVIVAIDGNDVTINYESDGTPFSQDTGSNGINEGDTYVGPGEATITDEGTPVSAMEKEAGGVVGNIGASNGEFFELEIIETIIPNFFWNQKTMALYDDNKLESIGWHGFDPIDWSYVNVNHFTDDYDSDKELQVTLVLDAHVSGLVAGEYVVQDDEKFGYVEAIRTENGEFLVDVQFPSNAKFLNGDWVVGSMLNEGTTYTVNGSEQEILEVRHLFERVVKSTSFVIQRPPYYIN